MPRWAPLRGALPRTRRAFTWNERQRSVGSARTQAHANSRARPGVRCFPPTAKLHPLIMTIVESTQVNMATKTETLAAETVSDPRWTAVIGRDPEADGKFFYSVKTTGVYCRPSCAARTARPENVGFHPTAVDAERAGFRPCKRCKPNQPRWPSSTRPRRPSCADSSRTPSRCPASRHWRTVPD